MRAEILMIGTELLLGQIDDTNATFIARTLAANGIHLRQKQTVGDNFDRICQALDAALARADVVICSGGLGPTEDDITRECVAHVLRRPLEFREELYESVVLRFAHLRHLITENNKKQATLPAGALALENPNGTAPGVIVEDARGVVVLLPGPPFELQPMLEEKVLPYLRQRFGLQGVVHYRVLKVAGVGESRVDEMLGDLITTGTNPTVGLLASPEGVKVRIAAFAEDLPAANALIDDTAARVHERLPGLIFGEDEDTLEAVIDRMLAARGWRLSTLEMASGGMLAQRLVASGSTQFAGGQVVPPVPVPTDQEILDAARQNSVLYQSDCAIAVLGTAAQGAVRAGFISPGGEAVWEMPRLGDGARLQLRIAISALERIRRHMAGVRFTA